MTLADRNKIDNIIKEYLLIDIRIKILKAKIKYNEYNNCKSVSIRCNNEINKLEKFRGIIQSNVKNEYLENLEIFKMDIDDAIQEFNINRNNLFKLKKEIREEFIKVLDIVEAE